MEVALPMQRISALKQNGQQEAQLTEYQKKDIHKVIVTANSDDINLMQVKSDINGNVISLHLEFTEDSTGIGEDKSNINDEVFSLHFEFTEDSTGIGEEIRETLREKYLNKADLGSLQRKSSALQSSSQEGETGGKDT